MALPNQQTYGGIPENLQNSEYGGIPEQLGQSNNYGGVPIPLDNNDNNDNNNNNNNNNSVCLNRKPDTLSYNNVPSPPLASEYGLLPNQIAQNIDKDAKRANTKVKYTSLLPDAQANYGGIPEVLSPYGGIPEVLDEKNPKSNFDFKKKRHPNK